MHNLKRCFAVLMSTALLGSLLWTCSDDFLEVSPRGTLSQDVLASRAGVEGLLLGAYAQLNGRSNYFGGSTNWATGSIYGGEANKGTNDGDFTQLNDLVQYNLDPTSSIPSNRWGGLFEGVARTNATLATLALARESDPTLTDEAATRIEAEARFLLAHYYFSLKVTFNQAPILLPEMTLEEQQTTASTEDLYPFIEENMQFAFNNLPETQNEVGRANKWAAGAYLGKIFVYQEKWPEAESMLQDVVDNGVTAGGEAYGLLDNYADAFNAEFDNSKESVFAVQAAANTGTTNNANRDLVLNFPHNTGSSGPGNCCGFFQPSFDLVNSFRTQDGLPLLDQSYNNEGNRIANDFGVEATDPFTLDEGPVDPRLDHSVGRRGIPYLGWGPHPGKAWIRDQPYAGPYSPKKFVYYASQEGTLSDGTSWTRGYGSMNYNIIRFSDVLLLLAEAKAELGDLDGALELVNQVRARAAGDASLIRNADGSLAANYQIEEYNNFSSTDDALEKIYFERKLELSGEGHRYYDLRRWGLAAEELNRIVDFEQMFLPVAYANAQFDTPRDLYLPIPQQQIDLQGPDVLPQNPGYND